MSRMRAACRRKTRSLFENKESQKICGFSGFQFSRKVTERAHPAPLRGAAAAAAEGPINRRSAKNAFSEAASIFPLRLLPWGLKGACSPWRRVAAPSIRFVPWTALASCWPLPQQPLPVSAAGGGRSCCVAGWVESRGREGGVGTLLPASGPSGASFPLTSPLLCTIIFQK